MKKYFLEKVFSENFRLSSYDVLLRIDFESEYDMLFILTENADTYNDVKTHDYNFTYYYYKDNSLIQIKDCDIKPIAYHFYEDVNMKTGQILADPGEIYKLKDAYYDTPEYCQALSYSSGKKSNEDQRIITINTNILCFESENSALNYYNNGDMSGVVNLNTDIRVAKHVEATQYLNPCIYYNSYGFVPFNDTALGQEEVYNYHTNAINQSRYIDASKIVNLAYPEIKGGTAHILNDFEKSIIELENRIGDYTSETQYINSSDTEPSSHYSSSGMECIWQQEY